MRNKSTEVFLAEISDLSYVVERGVENIHVPLTSDIDILLAKRDRSAFNRRVKASGLLVSAASAYGGVRLFIGKTGSDLKRIDCTWALHYKGIPLLNTEELLGEGVVCPLTGVRSLPDSASAKIAFAVKNAYGGAERYRLLLERYGFSILSPSQRAIWLLKKILRHPLTSLSGTAGCILAYIRRFWKPSGLTLGGVTPDELRDSVVLKYLSQSREIAQHSALVGFLRSRLISDICIIPWAPCADLDLSCAKNLNEYEDLIIKHLRKKRSDLD